MAVFEEVGVRAIVEGAAKYVADATRVAKATEAIGPAGEQASKKVKSLDDQLRSLGSRLQETGRSAILFGSALAVPGVGATFLAGRYDEALTRISTLSGIAAKDIDELRKGIDDISSQTAQGPQALAEALLVITSTGIRGSQALEILRLSAQGAALGMGEAATVGRTLTAIIKAYGGSNITAARAADVLFATVREGGAEVDEVSGSLGRVVGIAATFGVSLEEVGAFLATFTRLGISADEAVTALRGTILAIFGPAEESKKALEGLGTSSDQLRAIVRERGLLSALRELIVLSKGDSEALSNLIPNVRALAGVLGTAGTQGEQYLAVLANITQSEGDYDKAFGDAAQRPLFRYKQALVDLQRELINIGTVALPALAGVASAVSQVLQFISALPEPVKAVGLAFTVLGGAALVAVGGLALISGSVVTLIANLPIIVGLLTSIGGVLLASPAGWIAVAGAVAAAGIAYALFRDRVREATEAQRASAETSRLATQASVEEMAQTLRSLSVKKQEAQARLDAERAQRDALGAATGDIKVMQEAQREIDRLNKVIKVYGEALQQRDQSERAAAKSAKDMSDATTAAATAATGATNPVVALSKRAEELQKSMQGVNSTALATKIILESIANIQGATFENILDLIDPGALQRQIEAAGASLRPILAVQEQIDAISGRVTNAAGRLTDSQKSEGDRAAREAEQAAEREQQRVQQTIDEAQRAQEQLAAARIRGIDQIGDLIVTALRRQAQQQLDVTIAGIDQQREALKRSIDDEIDAIKKRTDAAVRAAEEERDRTLEAIRAETEARIASVQAQIDALDQQASVEQRAAIQRRIALAYDAQERADAERELRDFDRRTQQSALRDSITGIRDEGRAREEETKRTTEERIQYLRDSAAALIEADQKARDAAIAGLDAQAAAARKTYEQQTTDFALQSEARRLLIEGETTAIAKLLDDLVPEWRSAGLSFGQQLAEGLRQSGVVNYINSILGTLNQINGMYGGAAGAQAGAKQAAAANSEIAGMQDAGMRARSGGAPESVLELLRRQLIERGVVPQFAGGLDVGVVKRPILAALDPGEVVLTPEQQRDYMGGGVRFESGAFDGMFRGASFNGSPRENARAIREEFESLIGRETGRRAFLDGV